MPTPFDIPPELQDNSKTQNLQKELTKTKNQLKHTQQKYKELQISYIRLKQEVQQVWLLLNIQLTANEVLNSTGKFVKDHYKNTFKKYQNLQKQLQLQIKQVDNQSYQCCCAQNRILSKYNQIIDQIRNARIGLQVKKKQKISLHQIKKRKLYARNQIKQKTSGDSQTVEFKIEQLQNQQNNQSNCKIVQYPQINLQINQQTNKSCKQHIAFKTLKKLYLLQKQKNLDQQRLYNFFKRLNQSYRLSYQQLTYRIAFLQSYKYFYQELRTYLFQLHRTKVIELDSYITLIIDSAMWNDIQRTSTYENIQNGKKNKQYSCNTIICRRINPDIGHIIKAKMKQIFMNNSIAMQNKDLADQIDSLQIKIKKGVYQSEKNQIIAQQDLRQTRINYDLNYNDQIAFNMSIQKFRSIIMTLNQDRQEVRLLINRIQEFTRVSLEEYNQYISYIS